MVNRESGSGPRGEAKIPVGARRQLSEELDGLLGEIDDLLIAEGVNPESHFPPYKNAGSTAIKGFEDSPQNVPGPGEAI